MNSIISDAMYNFARLQQCLTSARPRQTAYRLEVRLGANRMFLLRSTDGRLSLSVELEGIHDIPHGAVKSVMFYSDLMVSLCSRRFYVWEFTNRVLYNFTMEFASKSIDEFLSHKAWKPSTLPSTLVVLAEEQFFDNAVFEAKEMEWGRLKGINYEARRKINEDEIAELGELWNSYMKSW